MASDRCFDDGTTLRTLHEQVYGGPGVSALEPAVTSLTGVAEWLSTSRARLQAALKLEEGWSGPAHAAATAALDQAGNWTDTTGQAIHTSAAQLQGYADSFAQMKPQIVAPQPVPSLNWGDSVLGVFDASATDHARIEQANANTAKTALAAYAAHQNTTNNNINQLLTVNPPPQLTNPTPPPTTSPQPTPTPSRTHLVLPTQTTAPPPTRPSTAPPPPANPSHALGQRDTSPAPAASPSGTPSTGQYTSPTNAGPATTSAPPSTATLPSGWTPLPPPPAPARPTEPGPALTQRGPGAGIYPAPPYRLDPPGPASTPGNGRYLTRPAPAEPITGQLPRPINQHPLVREATGYNGVPNEPATTRSSSSPLAPPPVPPMTPARTRRPKPRRDDAEHLQHRSANPFDIDEPTNLAPPVLGLDPPPQDPQP